MAKIVAVRDQLPQARGDHLDRARPRTRCRSTSCASAAARVTPREVAERTAAVKPEDPYTIIYTSGTTGPPKGCVLTHGNYRQVTRMCEEIDVIEAGEPVYLFLPLAHSYALLIQLLAVDLGAPLIYWSGDPQQIVPDLMATKPGLPAVGPADLREDLHARHVQQRPGEDRRARPSSGLKVRRMQAAGQEVPAELQAMFDKADAELFVNVRNIFGGNLEAGDLRRRADRQGDPRVLLRLRRARARGLRHDRDLDGHHHLDGRRPQARHRRPPAPGLRGQDRRRRRDPRPRPAHLPGLLRQPATPPRSAP